MPAARGAKTRPPRHRRHPDAHPLDPTLDFLRLLWGIEHGLQSTSKRMEATLGITGPQRLVLKIVARFPGLSARELAHVVWLHPSTVTGILQRLVRKGLLARERDPVDGRRIRLRVRAHAKRFTDHASGTVEAAVKRALSRLSPAHVRDTRRVLVSIVHALEDPRSVK